MDNVNTNKAAIAQGTLETRDLDVVERGAGALWMLVLIGLFPCFLIGFRWFKISWPVGVPTTALAIYASADANKKREEITNNFMKAVNAKLDQ